MEAAGQALKDQSVVILNACRILNAFAEAAKLLTVPDGLPSIPDGRSKVTPKQLELAIKTHADDWTHANGMREQVIELSRQINDYAQTSLDILDVILDKAKNTDFSTLPPDKLASLKAEFQGDINFLRDAATEKKGKVNEMKFQLIGYEAKITTDSDNLRTLKGDYASFVSREQAQILEEEKREGVQSSEELVQRLAAETKAVQDEIDKDEFGVKASETSLYVSLALLYTGIGAAGAIASGIALAVEKSKLNEAMERLNPLKEELERVQRFSQISNFFTGSERTLNSLMEKILAGKKALEDMEGTWATIESDLADLVDGSQGLKRLETHFTQLLQNVWSDGARKLYTEIAEFTHTFPFIAYVQPV